jgi:hypothetical protein
LSMSLISVVPAPFCAATLLCGAAGGQLNLAGDAVKFTGAGRDFASKCRGQPHQRISVHGRHQYHQEQLRRLVEALLAGQLTRRRAARQDWELTPSGLATLLKNGTLMGVRSAPRAGKRENRPSGLRLPLIRLSRRKLTIPRAPHCGCSCPRTGAVSCCSRSEQTRCCCWLKGPISRQSVILPA